MARLDQSVLTTDTTFISRVRASMIGISVTIAVEAWTVAFHRERATYAAQVLNAPDTYKQIFVNLVAADATCISDATAAGTVSLTTANVAAQAALVTDAHIDAAVGNYYNTLFRCPSS